MNKQELRTYIKQQYNSSSSADREQWSVEVCYNILSDERIKKAKTVMAFYPLDDEVNIIPLLEKFNKEGKKVLLPVVVNDKDLVLRIYKGKEKMRAGVLGIYNPSGENYYDYDSIDAVLVPGQAFDKKGHRLGRGKGYYDRFLAKLSNVYTRAVCFPYQIVNEVPVEPYDVIIDYV
jgi:5-formyltetrahydrofolate cyclo-ligase